MRASLKQSVRDLLFDQPNDNEHKEEKQSARQDDAAFNYKFLDNTPYNMVNPLVLAICISNYDGDKFDNLKGVKQDMNTLKALWKGTFGFEMITNKINKKTNEYHVEDLQFWTKLDEARYTLNKRNDEKNDSDSDSGNNSGCDNKKDRYDGLIFVFAGHGYKAGIFTSDGKRIQMEKIKKHFSSKNVPSLKDSPKIFVIDACRHDRRLLPFEDDTLYRDPNFNEERGGNERLAKFKFYHPYVNMLEVYGNTRGYSVLGNDKKGGSLVLVLSKYLTHAHNSDNNKNKSKYNKYSKYGDMTFQQILNGMKRELHKTTGGNQTIELHDTLLYDIKFGKGCDDQGSDYDAVDINIGPCNNGTYPNQVFTIAMFKFCLNCIIAFVGLCFARIIYRY